MHGESKTPQSRSLCFTTVTKRYMVEITADSTIYDLLKAKPESSEVLFKFGMGCVGCAIARGETIREAAEAHGIPLPELLSALGIKE